MLKKLAHRLIATSLVMLVVMSLVVAVPQSVFANSSSENSNNLNQDGGLSPFQRTHAQLVQESRASGNSGVAEISVPRDMKSEWVSACNEGRAAETPNGFCSRVANTTGATTANPNPNLPIGTSELTEDFNAEAFDLAWYRSTFGGGFTPPDTMGAVGPTQFFVTQNGAYRVFDKTTGAPITALDTLASAFWPASVDPNDNGGGDPRVRFDRLTDTWWVIAFTRENADNRVIYAQSDGPILSLATVWTYWYITPLNTINGGADAGKFADYPTLGVDSNAVLIGANMFPPAGSATTSAFVTRLVDFPGAGGDASSVTHAFTNLTACAGGACIWTPMPVDSYDASANSYFVGQMAAGDDIMQLGTVTYPAGVPSIAWQTISVNTKNDGWTSNSTPPGFGVPYLGVPAPTGSGANWGLDTLSWRAIGGAHLRDGSIWFTNTSSVQGPQGDLLLFPLHGDRMSVVVYEFSTAGAVLTDTNIYDAVTPEGANPTQVWMGSVIPNGQGHAVAGFTMTNLNGLAPSTGWSGRLASDPNGYFSPPVVSIEGFNTGNLRQYFETGARATRWGDYSMVTVDPCDDMTFWSQQEYSGPGQITYPLGVGGNWATGFTRIRSLPPTVEGVGTNPVPTGAASNVINITGEDFYDTDATASPSCRERLEAIITSNPGGVVINDITFNSPTSVDLDIDTSGASCGELKVDVTNPDGQSDEVVINIGTAVQCGVAAPSNDNVANATVVTSATNLTQDMAGATSEGTDPTLPCGDPSYTSSVWYQYTPADGKVFATEINANAFDAVVALLSGTPGDFNVLSCDVGSVVSGSLKSGETYYIMVANSNSSPITEPTSVELTNYTFVQNDALALFNSSTSGTSLLDTALDDPSSSSYNTFTNTPPNTPSDNHWIMGDWNGDGVKTPAYYRQGAFRYTNDLGPTANWSLGWWFGFAGSQQGIVAGRFDPAFDNDCFGLVDGNLNVNNEMRFSLKYWCDMAIRPQDPGGGPLFKQWLGALLQDSQGFEGTFSFAAGDWDADAFDEMAVRRSEYITYTFVEPDAGAGTFGQSQRWAATGGGIGPGGHDKDEGVFVAGDWDGDGMDTFGVVYSDAEFYYRNVFGFNPGPWQFIFQGFTDPISFNQASSTKTATGGNGPEFPFGPEGVQRLAGPDGILGTADDVIVGNGGGTFDTSQNVEADLSVSKAGNFQVGEVGLVGDTITWTITVANTGTASANGVQITDNVPGELRVDDALADLGTVTVQGQRVTFTVESLGVGQSAQFSVVTTILAQPSSGLFNNSVNVLLPDGEGSGSNANLVASSSVSSVDGLPATGYAPKFRW